MKIPKIGEKIKVKITDAFNSKGFSNRTMKVSFVKDKESIICNECKKLLEKGTIQTVSSGIHVCWECACNREIL
jgi:RNase P subunit RPR2